VVNLSTDEKNLRNLLTKIIPRIPKLENLKLSLPKSRLNDDLLEVFVENNARSFQNISSFKANFSETMITDRSLIKLLSEIRTAKDLHLCLNSTEVTDNFTRGFMITVHEDMKDLKNFGLHLKNTKVKESIGLLGNLSQLTKLLLDFSETCTRSEDIERFNRDVLQAWRSWSILNYI